MTPGRLQIMLSSLSSVSVSEEILGIVINPDATARATLNSLQVLFCDIKKARPLSLEAEFYNLAQGDQSILAYSQQLKSYADTLADND